MYIIDEIHVHVYAPHSKLQVKNSPILFGSRLAQIPLPGFAL